MKSKLSGTFVELFAEVFCCLPLAHVINEKVFVVHGGLFSVDGVKLSDIRAIDRFCEPPKEGLMKELLWSDPQPQLGRGPTKRGIGLSFGADVTNRFLQENKLDLVVRSHEFKDDGYEIQHDGKLITVFSAPNYCDQMGNTGAFIRFEAPELKPNIVIFSAVPHPGVEPMAYTNNFLEPYPEITESCTFDLWVGGLLEWAPTVRYVGGTRMMFPDVDIDTFSFQDITSMYMEAGGKFSDIHVYYCLPGHDLGSGIQILNGNEGIIEMQSAYKGLPVVSVFIVDKQLDTDY